MAEAPESTVVEDLSTCLLVAVSSSGVLLGVVTAQLEEQETPQQQHGATRQMVLLTLVVAPDAQQAGVGSALLRMLLVRAKLSGAARVVADVATANDPAIRFFRKHGFTQSQTSDEAAARQAAAAAAATGFGGGKRSKAPPRRKQPKHSPTAATIEMVRELGMDSYDDTMTVEPPSTPVAKGLGSARRVTTLACAPPLCLRCTRVLGLPRPSVGAALPALVISAPRQLYAHCGKFPCLPRLRLM